MTPQTPFLRLMPWNNDKASQASLGPDLQILPLFLPAC